MIKKITKEQEQLLFENANKLFESDLKNNFDEVIDESYESFEISGYSYRASAVLKSVDPVVYNEEFSYYLDSLNDVLCELECDERAIHYRVTLEDFNRILENAL